MAHTAISTFTTPDEVRAVLGVSSTELTDSMLSLPIYPIVIEMALDDIHLDLRSDYDTVLALPSQTAAQHRFLDATKMFALYALANHLLASLPMFSVQTLTDGRASFTRQADVQLEAVDAVRAMYLSLKYRLAAAYQTLYPTNSVVTSITETLVKATGLNLNPVTGV